LQRQESMEDWVTYGIINFVGGAKDGPHWSEDGH
jgi:hypothetical protein